MLRASFALLVLAACAPRTAGEGDLEARARDLAAGYPARFPLLEERGAEAGATSGGERTDPGIGGATSMRMALAGRERELLALPPDADVRRELGELYTQVEEHARGMSYLAAALADAPDDPQTWLWLGANRLSAGELEDAETLLRFAEQLEPRDPRMPRYLGETEKLLGRRDEAIAAFERAIAIEPRYAEALAERATLLTDAGRADEAHAALEALLAADPEHPTGLWLLARSLDERGAPGDAERAEELRARHRRATWIDDLGLREGELPREIVLVRLALHYLQIGEPENAERELRAVFELDPSDPAVRANALAALADALFRQDEERGALEALVELERHMPEHPMCARLAREAELRGLR